jgi:hypothetical protein
MIQRRTPGYDTVGRKGIHRVTGRDRLPRHAFDGREHLVGQGMGHDLWVCEKIEATIRPEEDPANKRIAFFPQSNIKSKLTMSVNAGEPRKIADPYVCLLVGGRNKRLHLPQVLCSAIGADGVFRHDSLLPHFRRDNYLVASFAGRIRQERDCGP